MIITIPAPPQWMEDASCAQIGPSMADLWFPEKNGCTYATEPVRQVCASCPVRAECLQYALDNDIRDGYWGGKSAARRAQLKARRAS